MGTSYLHCVYKVGRNMASCIIIVCPSGPNASRKNLPSSPFVAMLYGGLCTSPDTIFDLASWNRWAALVYRSCFDNR
eukprot:m.842449 g.842449  ORF g.842449 m.842449 type:complete len:77 (-) comp23470_c1_seq60:368-598(-)